MGDLRPRTDSTRRLIFLLLGVFLPPAVALVWLGVRLLAQDHAFIRQRDNERREAAADALTRGMVAALSEAEAALTGGEGPPGSVRVRITPTSVDSDAGMKPLWLPAAPPLPEWATQPFEDAERDEFQRRGDEGRARYVTLSTAPDPAVRAGALVRVARVARRHGKTDDAVAAYRDLQRLRTVAVNGTPADLLARRMICETLEDTGRRDELHREAVALETEFVRGDWRLDRAAWQLAATDIERWTGTRVGSVEQRAVAAAIEQFSGEWRASPARVTAGRRVFPGDGPPVTLLWRGSAADVTLLAFGPTVVADWIRTARERGVMTTARVTATSEQGIFIAGDPAPPATGAGEIMTVLRSPLESGLPWRLAISGGSPSDVDAELAGRRRLFGGGLAALVLLFGGGSYSLWRVVRREIAVARLQTGFVAAVSHEFRTPLTSLRHITELLQESDDMPAERRRSFYTLLGQSTDRLHRLVESVLDFARMEAGRRPWTMRPHDVVEFLDRVVAQFARENAGRSVVLDRPRRDVPLVSFDSEALTHAVWNLLDNAVKYSPAGGIVRVAADVDGNRVAIRVTDDGVGIPAAERGAILGKFVRGSRAEELGIKGTGLGLAIVAHIVDAHGGGLEVDSEEGRGSTFTITLPAGKVSTASEAAGTQSATALNVHNSHR